MSSTYLVLVVEDDSNAFEMLKRSLRRTELFELVWAKTAAEGLAALSEMEFDVILLDLTLPDSRGVETVDVFTKDPVAPVVVLTGIDDEDLAFQSVKKGAHDYLVKGKFDTPLLSKTLSYTIERFRLVEQLNETRQLINRERELRRLESDANLAQASPTSHPQPQALRDAYADTFSGSVDRYADLIDEAIEQRKYKGKTSLGEPLRELAKILGMHGATPKDVIDIHTTSVSAKLLDQPARRGAHINAEARYLLAGLLGYLCSFYQSHVPTLLIQKDVDDMSPRDQRPPGDSAKDMARGLGQ